jgi:hypothetical protein
MLYEFVIDVAYILSAITIKNIDKKLLPYAHVRSEEKLIFHVIRNEFQQRSVTLVALFIFYFNVPYTCIYSNVHVRA